MRKNKDGFEPGQALTFEEVQEAIRIANARADRIANARAEKKSSQSKSKGDE